jgi:ATP-dependent RNA helicase RhlB
MVDFISHPSMKPEPGKPDRKAADSHAPRRQPDDAKAGGRETGRRPDVDPPPVRADAPRPGDGLATSEPTQKPKRRRRRRKPRSERAGAHAEAPDRGDAPPPPESPERTERRPEPVGEQPEPETPWDRASVSVPEQEGKTRFLDLGLADPILRAICDLGFQYSTPIQTALLPAVIEGRDAGGLAPTGTGKTAAFLIGIFQNMLSRPEEKPRRNGTPRALILAPTRELAIQIHSDAEAIARYLDLNLLAVYGGLDYGKQERTLLENRIDMIVATPGRLIDYFNKHTVHLSHVESLVIDEADRMLDMGFIPDVRRIVRATPPRDQRQTLLFSATLTPEVTRLASQWMKDPVHVEIERESVDKGSVDQRVYIVTSDQRFPLLVHLLRREQPERVIIFANRRDAVDRLADELYRFGFDCEKLSGSVPQNKRLRTLERFRQGDVRILVATDVAGRGLHIEGVSHIVNFNVPQDAEDYVHRIGRTGRAGAKGTSITFACESESFYLPAIEEYLGEGLPYMQPEPDWTELKERPVRQAPPRSESAERPSRRGSSGGRRGSSGSGRSRR